jgi:hypothetical protein
MTSISTNERSAPIFDFLSSKFNNFFLFCFLIFLEEKKGDNNNNNERLEIVDVSHSGRRHPRKKEKVQKTFYFFILSTLSVIRVTLN